MKTRCETPLRGVDTHVLVDIDVEDDICLEKDDCISEYTFCVFKIGSLSSRSKSMVL